MAAAHRLVRPLTCASGRLARSAHAVVASDNCTDPNASTAVCCFTVRSFHLLGPDLFIRGSPPRLNQPNYCAGDEAEARGNRYAQRTKAGGQGEASTGHHPQRNIQVRINELRFHFPTVASLIRRW